MTRATSAVGCTMSSIRSLTERTLDSQLPVALRTWPRSPMRPSLPTTRLSRSNSLRELVVDLDDLVEGLGDLGVDAVVVVGEDEPKSRRA